MLGLVYMGMGVALALDFVGWTQTLQPGVTEANARLIQKGMTMAKVEAILRVPGKLLGSQHGGCHSAFQWSGPDVKVVVEFWNRNLNVPRGELVRTNFSRFHMSGSGGVFSPAELAGSVHKVEFYRQHRPQPPPPPRTGFGG